MYLKFHSKLIGNIRGVVEILFSIFVMRRVKQPGLQFSVIDSTVVSKTALFGRFSIN